MAFKMPVFAFKIKQHNFLIPVRKGSFLFKCKEQRYDKDSNVYTESLYENENELKI